MPNHPPGPRGPDDDPVARRRALATWALHGDAAAWEQLVSELEGVVWTVLRGLGLDRREAEAVALVVWLRLVDRLGTTEQPADVAAFLASVARQEGEVVVRDRSTIRTLASSSAGPARRGAEAPGGGQDDRILGAYEDLPERCRLLLRLLVTVPELRYQEISRLLDMPIGSIGPTRSRCLRRLATGAGMGGTG